MDLVLLFTQYLSLCDFFSSPMRIRRVAKALQGTRNTAANVEDFKAPQPQRFVAGNKVPMIDSAISHEPVLRSVSAIE
jgi:hypothetical protein